MQEIDYIGEHLLPGHLGHFLIVTGFVSAILAILAYRKSTILHQESSWLSLVQLVLVSMIAGIYFTDDFKMGSSPFLLLRDTMAGGVHQCSLFLAWTNVSTCRKSQDSR